MDIQDVSHVIQFMVPSLLSVWMQHLGHAGRSGEPAIVILLVEPSVYKLKKSRGDVGPEDLDDEDKDDEDKDVGDEDSNTGLVGSADPTYQKKVKKGMWKWIEAIKCRHIVADAYFNNPPCTTGKPFLMYIRQYLMTF
jgi:superfamily II DNA helicase RecQ